MRRAARILERNNFIVKFLPLRAEDMRERDEHVNFLGASSNGTANFGHAILKRRESRWKSCGDGSDVDLRPFQCAPRRFHKQVINANGADLNVQIRDTEFLHEFVLKGLARFRAK